MAKITQAEREEQLRKVLFAFSGFPEGASLEELRIRLDPSMPERTLSRYLSILQERGKIRTSEVMGE